MMAMGGNSIDPAYISPSKMPVPDGEPGEGLPEDFDDMDEEMKQVIMMSLASAKEEETLRKTEKSKSSKEESKEEKTEIDYLLLCSQKVEPEEP